MSYGRTCPWCLEPKPDCICDDEEEAGRLRRAIGEADEGKAVPWEYDGFQDRSGEEDG